MLLLVRISCWCMCVLVDMVYNIFWLFLWVVYNIMFVLGVKFGDLFSDFGDSVF